MTRAKAQRRQGDGPRPVIPSECEGSKKHFSPVEYVANDDLTLRVVIPRGRNDKESFFASWRLGARTEFLGVVPDLQRGKPSTKTQALIASYRSFVTYSG